MKKLFLKNTYLRYTFLFLMLLPVIFLPFIIEDKTFVWNLDGIGQHFPILVYYGKLLKGLFTGHGFPMFDFNLGLGFDTITTLHYYVIGDPLALLSVFITPKTEVFFYGAIILLRFYLAGISYLVFMKFWKKDGLGVILGALIYVFCGYALIAGVRHPYFLNPMIYLPLILIGLEQVLRQKKPYLLVVMAFISTISNFYFFYILTVIVVIYVIFRYFYQYRKSFSNIITGLLMTGFRTGGYYLLGTSMAAFMLLPVIYAFMQNGRFDSKPSVITGYLFYNKEYYLSLFQAIFAPGVPLSYWVVLTFPSIIVVSLVILFCNMKFRQPRIVLLLSLGALSVPFFGYFINGLAYITNRWVFLISLLIAVIFAITYEKLFELDRREKVTLSAVIVIYGILTFASPSVRFVKYEFFIILLSAIIILILQTKWLKNKKVLQKITLSILVFLTLGYHGYAIYSPQYSGYVNEFLTKNKVEEFSGKGVLALIPEIKDDSFYRIETYGDYTLNEALKVGFHDVSGYFSLMDGNITTDFKQLDLTSQRLAFRFDNMDNRTILDSLLNVKYLVSTDKNAAPYGYQQLKKVKKGSKSYYLFENKYALPLGYTYENYMLEDDYNKLSSLEKQNAQMYAIILDKENNYVDKTKQIMDAGIEKLDAKIITDKNVEISKSTIKVKKEKATITLEFNSKPNTETYIRFGNLILNEKAKTTFYVIGDKGAEKPVNVRGIYYDSNFGKENYLINIGYSEAGKTKVKIRFPEIKTYTYDSLAVYSVDMKYYKAQVTELNKSSLYNIEQGNNQIQGDVTLDKNGIMAFSIPYSIGWKAYVDGTKAEILRGNVMFMALPLEAGEHHIVLKYTTPLLREGSMISLVAFMIFIGIIIFNRRNRKLSCNGEGNE